MNKFAAFTTGMVKEADTELDDIIVAALLGLPIAAGAGVGAIVSKATSPGANIRPAQKEMLLAETEQALAELKRQSLADKRSKKSTRSVASYERPLHI